MRAGSAARVGRLPRVRRGASRCCRLSHSANRACSRSFRLVKRDRIRNARSGLPGSPPGGRMAGDVGFDPVRSGLRPRGRRRLRDPRHRPPELGRGAWGTSKLQRRWSCPPGRGHQAGKRSAGRLSSRPLPRKSATAGRRRFSRAPRGRSCSAAYICRWSGLSPRLAARPISFWAESSREMHGSRRRAILSAPCAGTGSAFPPRDGGTVCASASSTGFPGAGLQSSGSSLTFSGWRPRRAWRCRPPSTGPRSRRPARQGPTVFARAVGSARDNAHAPARGSDGRRLQPA